MPSVIRFIAHGSARIYPLCMRGMLRLACVLLALLATATLLPGSLGWLAVGDASAASAYSARNSGMDPPGEPKHIETLPSRNVSRTAEGGMGYTDAYGNTIEDRQPEEKPAPKRPRPGAYGVGAGKNKHYERPLPDPQNQTPAWSFK